MTILLKDLMKPEVLVSLYKSGTSLSLEGAPGIGKSHNIRRIPEILSEALGVPFGYKEEMMTNLDAPDAKGFLIPTKDPETGRAVSHYAYPTIMPTPEYLQQYPQGVLYLDEYDSSDQLVKKAVAPVIYEGRNGEYSIPLTTPQRMGWWVITAGNGMQHKSGATKPMAHEINRRRILQVRSSVDGWVEWAQEHNKHPLCIAFAKQNPGVVFSDEVPAELRPFCTARSFTSTIDFIQELVGDDMNIPSDHITQECVAGDIGEGAAATFFGWIKVADALDTIENMVNHPETCKCPGPERLDAAHAALQMVLHHVNPENLDPLWCFIERLPRELQTTSARQIMDKLSRGGAALGPMLNSPRFGKWVKANNALIIATDS